LRVIEEEFKISGLDKILPTPMGVIAALFWKFESGE
jgi:hypothetical protein